MDFKKLNWQAFPIALIVVAIYLCVGFTTGLWHPTWLIFFAIPLYHWTVDIIKNKRIKGFPTFVSVIAATIIFLGIGFGMKVWHPTWLIFLAIPITSSMEYFFAGGMRGTVKKAGENIKKKVFNTDEDHADIE